MADYRKPGVYVEESLLINSADTSAATTTALFVGVAGTGPINSPVRCESWSAYAANFGGFDPVTNGAGVSFVSYLPYTVYSYFQNGGRPAYVQRAVVAATGTAASLSVTDGPVVTASINQKRANTSAGNIVATLTTSAAHGFEVGRDVTVSGVNSPFDKPSVTITAIPSPTEFSYLLPAGTSTTGLTTNVAVAPVGTATELSTASFTVAANSVGTAGNRLSVVLVEVDITNDVYTLIVYRDGAEVERFQYLTVTGNVPGTRRFDAAVNDPYSGSTLVNVSVPNPDAPPMAFLTPRALTGGVDANLPVAGDFGPAAVAAAAKIEGPILINLVGYTPDITDPDDYIAPTPISQQTSFPDRGDVFIINDSMRQRKANETSSTYRSQLAASLGQYTGDSYVAAYTPWIIVPNPKQAGATITIPPGGAVAGVMSRIDTTTGVFRAPAGIIAQITNAVGVDTKFSDSELGDLNSSNINVTRPVTGTGIAIMGARTRKLYGADRYVSARRTLIYIKESLRRSTSYALFENNDQRLWSQLTMTAERILRPLWEAGGLRGNSAKDAYYITCDETVNTPSVIASGEVRLECGVALEYPAEFIVIRVTQFESGGFTAEVSPRG